jgi:hypothetical protein
VEIPDVAYPNLSATLRIGVVKCSSFKQVSVATVFDAECRANLIPLGFGHTAQRTTQAILSLTSLLQKAVIEPAERQSREIGDIKERLDRLENAH